MSDIRSSYLLSCESTSFSPYRPSVYHNGYVAPATASDRTIASLPVANFPTPLGASGPPAGELSEVSSAPPSPPLLAPKRQCRSLTLMRGGLYRPVPVRPSGGGPQLELGLRDLRLCAGVREPPPPPPPQSPRDSLSPQSFPSFSPSGMSPPSHWLPPWSPAQQRPIIQQHLRLHQRRLQSQSRQPPSHHRRRCHRRQLRQLRQPPLQAPPREPPLPSSGRRFLVGLPHIVCSPSPLPQRWDVEADDAVQFIDDFNEDDDGLDKDPGYEDADSGCEDVRGVELDVDEIESDL